MNCKDCIHYGACVNWIEEVKNEFNINASLLASDCTYFKDKSKVIELPCKVGDTIYVIPSKTNYTLNKMQGFSHLNKIYKPTVITISVWNNNDYSIRAADGTVKAVSQLYGITWFLTEEEAKKALKELENEDNL